MLGQDISDELDDEDSKRGLSKLLSHKYQNFKRATQIAAALSKYGFGRLGPSKKRIQEEGEDPEMTQDIKKMDQAVRFRLMLQGLGPTFVKLGQMLSTRPDLIDEEFADELGNLRDSVPPEPPEVIRAIILKELGSPVEELFDDFPDKPIAAASIGQVFKARIKGTDEWVAVKVQRSNILNTIRADIAVLKDMSKILIRAFRSIEGLDPVGAVDEFGIMIMRELDYTLEARNITRLAANMADVDRVRVPDLHMDLSSSRVLTMEFVDGVAMDKLGQPGAPNVDGKELIAPLTTAIIKQIFIDGFFHADPHHGNLFVDQKGDVVFIDLGAMGYLERGMRNEVSEFYMALMQGDEEKAAISITQICGASLGDVNLSRLSHDIRDYMDFLELRKKGYDIAKGINQKPVTIIMKNGLHPPTSWVLLDRAMLQLEGVIMTLDPKTDYMSVASDNLGMLAKEKLKPQRQQPLEALLTARNYVEFLREFPTRADRIMTKIETDSLTVQVEIPDLEDFRGMLRKAALVVSVSLLAFALVLGSIITGETLIGPWMGIHFTVAFIVFVWILAVYFIQKRL